MPKRTLTLPAHGCLKVSAVGDAGAVVADAMHERLEIRMWTLPGAVVTIFRPGY